MARPIHWSEQPAKLIQHISKVKASREALTTEGRTYLQLYHNRPNTLTQGAVSMLTLDANGIRDLGFNTLAEAVATARSQIAQPLKAVCTPTSAAAGTGWETKRACEQLGLLISGVMAANRFRNIASQLVVDGMLCSEGHAVWEVDPILKSLVCKRLDPLESFWTMDRSEFVTTRCVSRRWLKATFGTTPELEAAIDGLRQYKPEHVVGVDAIDMFATEDNVAWYEAWQAPVGRLSGRHIVVLSKDVVIIDEECSMIPVISSRWEEGHRGPTDGKPLGRTVSPFMAWEREMHFKMLDGLAGSVPKIFGPAGTKAPSDAPYEVIEEDTPNTVRIQLPDSVSEHVAQQIDKLHDGALRAVGTNDEASRGQVEPQYKSGIALAWAVSIATTRLSHAHLGWEEDLHEQSGRIIATLGPTVYKDKPVNVETSIGSSVIKQIDWSKLDLPEKSYELSFDVVSALGDTVSQKLENLNTAQQTGLIDNTELWLHADVPDFRGIVKEKLGPRSYIAWQVSRALEDGVVEPPAPFQVASDAATVCSNALQAALAETIPPPDSSIDALFTLWQLFVNAGQVPQVTPLPLPGPGPVPGLPPTGAPPAPAAAPPPPPTV